MKATPTSSSASPRPWPKSASTWQKARAGWLELARPDQLPPAGDWEAWFDLGGRGSGKTRTGAEDVSDFCRRTPRARYALVAPTLEDVRLTMVEGESGLLAVLPPSALRGAAVDSAWNRTRCELYLSNGSFLKGYSSERPGRLRGPQHHRAWVDEPAELGDAGKGLEAESTTWSNLVFGLRLGERPQVVLTGTPKPVRLVRELIARARRRDGVVLTTATTYANLDNLSPFYRRLIARFEGTRTGRQELLAELLEDVEGALWRRGSFDEHRVWLDREPKMPGRGVLARIVVALDPAGGTAEGDEQAITVAALGLDRRYYVIHSEGIRTDPIEWIKRAFRIYDHYGADVLVYEKNYGDAFLKALVRQTAQEWSNPVAHHDVPATRGKRTRAEPIAMLYEQHKVSHVGVHDVLEDQMANYTGAPGEASPDRLDATVWALTELAKNQAGPSSTRRDGTPQGEMADLATANF